MVTNKANSKLDKIKGGKFLDAPPSISHYTNIGGMMGIIDKGCVWASNVSYLNDREELVHGLRGATKALKRVLNDKTYANWASSLEAVVKEITDGRMPNTYAACFCQRTDVLSQWRGYGGSDQAVAITFKRQELEDLFVFHKAKLYPVVYGALKANKQITDHLRTNLDELTVYEFAAGNYSRSEKSKHAYYMLSRLLPQFKNIGFQDEREWRFVVQHETVRDLVCFRPVGNVIVPYIKLGPGEGAHLPIKSIRIGPGRDMELTKRRVELYLTTKGYSDTREPLAKLQWCDEFSTGMSGKRGVRGVLG
jgi:Protein of unknown function (DUF2971)